MKIIGAEGIDAASVRAEIDRGARFVMYVWCVSFLVLSLKRPSSIYFIRAGQSRAFRSWPFTLTSLLFGWWGFPWGIIYTFEALIKNLGGGVDVTEAVMAELAGAAGSPVAATASRSPELVAPAPAKSPVTGGSVLKALGLVAAALLVIFTIWSLYLGQNMPVALVNGAGASYTVEIAGERRAIPTKSPLLFSLPEGRHTMTFKLPADASPQTREVEFNSSFWSRPFEPRVVVLNPDAGAIVYEETTEYRRDDDPKHSPNHVVVHTGEPVYILPKPDFFFDEFPQRLQLPGGSPVSKRRIAAVTDVHPSDMVAMLTEHRGEKTAAKFVLRQGALRPDDEKMLLTVFNHLKPEAGQSFFDQHLADRPVRLEWHRYYQQFAEYNLPELDLETQYATWAAREPQNGALQYLAGRIVGDFARARAYYERALAAAEPCAYAYNGLAFEAQVKGEFASALSLIEKAEQAGIVSHSLIQNRRHLMIAAGRADDLLLETVAARKAAPGNFELVAREIQLNALTGRDRSASENIIREYSRANDKILSPENRTQVETYLRALIAYGEGDEAAYSDLLAQLPGPGNALFVAITRCDHAGAAELLSALPRTAGRMWMLLYLAALEKGDRTAAETYYGKAIAAYGTEGREMKQLAQQLQSGTPPDAAAFSQVPLPMEEKCVLATVLGLRDPAQRGAYFKWARLMNISPDFPHQFIRRMVDRKPLAAKSL